MEKTLEDTEVLALQEQIIVTMEKKGHILRK